MERRNRRPLFAIIGTHVGAPDPFADPDPNFLERRFWFDTRGWWWYGLLPTGITARCQLWRYFSGYTEMFGRRKRVYEDESIFARAEHLPSNNKFLLVIFRALPHRNGVRRDPGVLPWRAAHEATEGLTEGTLGLARSPIKPTT